MDFIGAHLQYADDIIVNAKATVDELKKTGDSPESRITALPCGTAGSKF